MTEPDQPPPTTTSTTTRATTSSPSPSPPPTAPIALAPGHRASNFIALYNHALNKTLDSMSYENFAACFPTIAEKAGDTLKGAHRSVVETLGRSARAEFEKILTDHAVIPNLNALEELIITARSRLLQHQASLPSPPPFSSSQTPISPPNPPPHTLPPATLVSAHLSPLLIAQNSQLNARLQTVQSQNAGLMDEIRKQRKEIEELLVGIEGKVGDLEGAGQALGDEGSENRGRAARGAEGVLVGVE